MAGVIGPIAAEAIALPATTPIPPAATSLVRPVAHYVYTYVVGSMATLSTVWAEPASCVTAAPTLYAGTCNTASCSAFAPSRLSDLLYTYGLTVNYPGFTTGQELTSTGCMPLGYAPLKSMYFTGGTQCPVSWTTATVEQNSYSSSNTIVCCPTSYAATSISGNAGYDCYANMTLKAQQNVVLVAEGDIATPRPATVPSTVGWVYSWTSRSVITTTAWPTATVADLYHPAVNFLVAGQAATPTSTAGSSSSSSSLPAFSLFQLGLGASIGVLIVIAIGGLTGLCCLYALIRRLACGPRRVRQPPQQPQQSQQPPIYYPPPGGPPPMQYAQPQYPYTPNAPPPAHYAQAPYQSHEPYGYPK
ncbi:hypothetical protein B0H67DRAFT_645997 [Lasiosphaeris hirsuta]|uniref:Uncharacterized protein n=1 Tax=Lasiosphaeris hirsuta TaxID=260670 RepID=A0AA40DWN7_9PEZI|nr:hypothetical protein B0H67DRAFT_645997 [Lasiosphaeris hirsuta]